MTQRTHSTGSPTDPADPADDRADRAPQVGDALGHYRIIGVVGDGRLGRLYVAEQHGIPGISKIVALRRIRSNVAQSEDFRARFLDASRMPARLEHPNLVSLYEVSEVKGSYLISMEYLPGENLASILTRCNATALMPADIAAYVVKQAANAVQYLHDLRGAAPRHAPLDHDEVDPSHLFVTYHGTVKLLSVGLRSLEGDAARRADVFRLGLVLWTCLTGHKPRFAQQEGEVGAGVPTQPLLPPSHMRADVPEGLDAIAMRALSPDFRERFQSALELSEALDLYLHRRGTRPTPKHLRRWLEQVFDHERASLKLQIARARDVEGALSLLAAPQRGSGTAAVASARSSPRPRELWSTSHSVFSRLTRGSIAPAHALEPGSASASHERLVVGSILPRHTPSTFAAGVTLPAVDLRTRAESRSRQPRTWLLGVMLVACVAIAGGTALILSSSDQSSPFRDASRNAPPSDHSGRLDVRSSPDGASVFVDGEPTGLRTPVVLKGLADGRTLRLRVDKAGFASQEREVAIVGGSVVTHAFLLLASEGLVHLGGAPAGARIYVDDVAVPIKNGAPLSLSVGRHALRVETPNALVFSGTVDVAPGEQTIRVDGSKAIP